MVLLAGFAANCIGSFVNELADDRRLCVTKQAPAFVRSIDQLRGQTLDKGVVQPFFASVRARGGHLIRELLGHGDEHFDKSIGIRPRFTGKFLPLAQPDQAHLVFTPDFDREFGLAQTGFIAGKNARDVIERGKPDIRATQD